MDITTIDAARIELSPSTASIAVSQTTRFTPTLFSSDGKPLVGRLIQWTSLNNTVASVDAEGLVRGLSPGLATIQATSGSASGTAQLTVTAAPTIALAPTEITFSAVQNGATPGDRTVSVTNAGSGTLSGLSATVRYALGEPTGWLAATLMSTTAPTTLVLSATHGNIAAGTYTATVDVATTTGSTPLTVRLTVLSPAQAIGLGTTIVSFAASQGGANPAQQAVGVINAGGGTLTGLGAVVEYPSGQPTGWLSATLSGTTAPATLTLSAITGALPVGTHTASIRVSSPVAQNSPQTISVSFTIGGAQPVIEVSPRTLNFTGPRGGPNPADQLVQVTNVGASPVTGLAVSVTYPGGQPSGWLSAQLNTTTAPATITVGVATGTLPNGTYTATLGVSSPVAINSPQLVGVSFQVLEPVPSVPSNLTATPVSVSQINLGWTASTGDVARYRIERRTSASGAFVLIDSVAANTTAYQNSGLTPATLYAYRVQACNTTGCSGSSNEALASTPQAAPSAPSGLTASAVSGSRIDLAWSAAGGTVASYRIERRMGAAGTYAVIDSVSAATHTYQNSGLASETQYFYRVQACNTVGCSGFTNDASATTGQIAPGTPTALNATTFSASQINLAWTASTGTITRYRIERKTGAAGTFAVIDSVAATATTYQNTGLTAATLYFYRIQACNGAGCSAFSTETSATTHPLAPAGFTANAASSSQINLSWNASSGIVDSYKIERKTGAAAFTEIASVNGATFAYTDQGLTAATPYDYQVRACNAGGCSAFSVTSTATTQPAVPGAPSALLATTVSSSQIDLSWTAATGTVDTYRVERSATSGSGFTEIASVARTTTAYQNTGLSAATQYFYRVLACNTGGCTLPSAEASATTRPGAPLTLGATTVSSSQIDLSWSAAAGTDSYSVERSTTSGSGFIVIASGVLATTYQSTGLSAATQYFYRVLACNTGGCSGPGAEASATTRPAAPTGLNAIAGSSTQIDLSWSAAIGAVDYRVERSTTSGSGFTEITRGLTGTTYASTGLSAATQYFYRVLACNTGGCSVPGTEAWATTRPFAPGAPSGLTATTRSSSEIRLSWTAAPTATVDSYRIERRTGANAYAEIASVSSATLDHSDQGLTAATPYDYQVRACNTGGCSGYTAPASATTQPATPGAPSALSATTASSSQIDLSWTAASGTVDSYRVERSATSGSGFTEIASLTGAAYQNTGLTPATQYFYRVRACNTGGCTAYTAEASATTQPAAPGVPSAFSATTVSSSQINLNWSAATGIVDTYRIERRTGANAYAEIASLPSGTLAHSDQGLTAATLYDYQVRACNTGGCSAHSTPASATTQPATPGAPAALSATAVSPSQINLSWTAASGTVDSYRVERSTSSGSGFTEIVSVTGTAHQDTARNPATQYFYRVRACNTGGCTAYTAEASATTQPAIPGVPSTLSATTVSSSQINLAWTAASGTVDNYRIERKTGAAVFAEIASVNGATFAHSDQGLTAATLYDYQVRACNISGCSAYSAPASATTHPATPGAPSALSATGVSSSQINLSWTAATGTVDTYRIEQSATSGVGFTEIASVTGTTYQNTGLTPTTQYFYRVRACNISGCGTYTAEASATTPMAVPGVPPGFSATAVSASQVDLRWNASSGTVDTYHIERRPGMGTFAPIATVSATTFTHSDMGLTASTQYDYRIQACNTGGCSSFTMPTPVTTGPPIPGAPSALGATTVSSTQISLSWTASSGTVVSYRVERSTTSGSGFVEIASVTATTYDNTTLTPATSYFYRVRACNTGGCTAYTAEASATTHPVAPGVPTAFSATTASSSQISLSWTASTGTVDTYRIDRKTGAGAFAE
ncbi:MAG: fibronectin type III domain-containing protein, partial [Gemmatimonadota bacterium]